MDAYEWFDLALRKELAGDMPFEVFLGRLRTGMVNAPDSVKSMLLSAIIDPEQEEVEPGEAVERFFNEMYSMGNKSIIAVTYKDGHRTVDVSCVDVEEGNG